MKINKKSKDYILWFECTNEKIEHLTDRENNNQEWKRCKSQFELIGSEPWSSNPISKERASIIYNKCTKIRSQDAFNKLKDNEKNICNDLYKIWNITTTPPWENIEQVFFCPKNTEQYKDFDTKQRHSCKQNLIYYKEQGLYDSDVYNNLFEDLNK